MEQLSGSSDADASVLNWNLLQTVSIIFCSLISVKLLCNLIFLVSIPSFCVGYINYSDIVESDIDRLDWLLLASFCWLTASLESLKLGLNASEGL